MARADNSYSRLVNWLKILLPLSALAILSTLFLLSHSIDPTQAIPLANVDVDALMREPRISAPDYAGVTEDGTALRFIAQSARPDIAHPGHTSAQMLQGWIDTPDGVTTTLASDAGKIDATAGQVELVGNVVLISSLGYHVETAQLTALLDRTRLESTGAITARGPFGDIAAGHMLLTQATDNTGTYVLVFNAGVNLIYDPKQ